MLLCLSCLLPLVEVRLFCRCVCVVQRLQPRGHVDEEVVRVHQRRAQRVQRAVLGIRARQAPGAGNLFSKLK